MGLGQLRSSFRHFSLEPASPKWAPAPDGQKSVRSFRVFFYGLGYRVPLKGSRRVSQRGALWEILLGVQGLGFEVSGLGFRLRV